MRPQRATITSDPAAGAVGDTNRAALATVLDLPIDEVPHFSAEHRTPTDAWAAERDWLAERDLVRINIAYPGNTSIGEIMVAVAMLNPGIYHLLTGVDRQGFGRTVICVNGRVAFDPGHDDDGVVRATPDGMFWVSFIGKHLVSEERRDRMQREDPAGFARHLAASSGAPKAGGSHAPL
jgi:hypothetical protein